MRWADVRPDAPASSTPEAVEAVVTDRTRLVAVTAASNLIGTRPDLPAIADVAHAVGALLWVDGVHATAHVLTDVPASGADFWVCSPYKFLGPHHGVLAASPALLETLHPDKLLPSSATPCRSASSSAPCPTSCSPAPPPPSTSSPISPAPQVAVRAATDSSPRSPPSRSTRTPCSPCWRSGCARSPASRHTASRSDAPRRCSSPSRATTRRTCAPGLAERGVNAPAGHFYAWECSHHLGLGAAGGLRMGLAPYTNAVRHRPARARARGDLRGEPMSRPVPLPRRARPGVRVGLPAPAGRRPERRARRGPPRRRRSSRSTRARAAGARDEPPADLLPARRRLRAGRARARRGQHRVRVEGARGLLRRRRRWTCGRRAPRGTTRAPCRRMPSWPVTSPSCRGSWTRASSTASGCGRRRAASTAGGSPTASSGPSRAAPAPGAGDWQPVTGRWERPHPCGGRLRRPRGGRVGLDTTRIHVGGRGQRRTQRSMTWLPSPYGSSTTRTAPQTPSPCSRTARGRD